MACSSCAQRRALLLSAMKDKVQGKPIGPQAAAFAVTVKKDLAAVKARLTRNR